LQWYSPRLRFEPPAAIRLPPVLDMLGVGAVVFRGSPPPDLRPMFVGNDYWVLPNPSALPRAFVPRQVEYEPDSDARLNKLLSPDFDARQIAYVESPIAQAGPAVGSVEILAEIPTRIEISARMQTAGLVVLADLFDEGWQAYVGGRPVPTLRTNHAVRGVVVPAGESIVEFRYWPAGLTQGLRWLGLGIAVLIVWFALTSRRRFKRETPP
jgi:hypothetical protein